MAYWAVEQERARRIEEIHQRHYDALLPVFEWIYQAVLDYRMEAIYGPCALSEGMGV